MNLEDLVRLTGTTPKPWSEGRTIPWNDPGFSARMLQEHLSQAHDAASRRGEVIDQHIAFLQRVALAKTPSRILDLGCGPGLYTSRLGSLGHDCTGIDFGPASIDHARAHAGPHERYELGDIRNVEVGTGYDLVMLLYGELNLFPRDEAVSLLQRCREAMTAEGRLVFEVHSSDLIRRLGKSEPRWRADPSGLFSDRPYLRLDQSFWLELEAMAAGRHWIVDAATGDVGLYGWCMQAYDDNEYARLLSDGGLKLDHTYPSLTGLEDDKGFPVLVATKASEQDVGYPQPASL